MATIYKIEIKTVSPFYSFSNRYIEEMFKAFLKTYRDEKTGLGFESTGIKVDIVK